MSMHPACLVSFLVAIVPWCALLLTVGTMQYYTVSTVPNNVLLLKQPRSIHVCTSTDSKQVYINSKEKILLMIAQLLHCYFTHAI